MADSAKDRFEESIRRAIETAKAGSEIVVYGASKLGWYVKTSLEARNVKVTHFVDQRPDRSVFRRDATIKTLSLDDHLAIRRSATTRVVVAILNGRTRAEVVAALGAVGVAVLDIDPHAFLFDYYLNVAHRRVDPAEFGETILKLSRLHDLPGSPYGRIADDLFVSPFVTGVVTQRCNLACYDCGQRIPFYTAPRTFDVEPIIADLTAYCSAFDLVPEISLHGGEPLLHPRIGEICERLSMVPNLVSINLITNGKIVPNEVTLRQFAAAGVDFHQSDYGPLSRHLNEVADAFSKNRIFSDIHFVDESEQWFRSSPIENKSRSPAQDDDVYRACIGSRICCQVMDGALYRCPLSAHGGAQGLFNQKPNEDYIMLERNGRGVPAEGLSGRIREFLTRDKALAACRYCDPGATKLVRPAIQLSQANRRILASGGVLE